MDIGTSNENLLELKSRLMNLSKETSIDELKLKVIESSLRLHDIIELLETPLTNPNPADRAIGIRFIADFLHALPKESLSSEELTFLCAFMVDRLKDHHSVTPNIIYAFVALVQQKHMLDEDLAQLIRSMFREVHCQTLLMGDRKNLYTILQRTVYQKLNVVQKMSTDFILGFIGMVDGEKDPRNLVFIFSFYPFIAQNVALGSFAEDMFEVTAAYFPIDFTPPQEDKLGITADDLVLGLRQCVAATDHFAVYSLPLLIEKISSEGTSAKIDSLQTLGACCSTYSAHSFSVQLLALWTELKNQVVESWNKEVEETALSVLSSVVAVVSKASEKDIQDKLQQMAKLALNDCLGFLNQPEQRLMIPSSDLLLALVKPSKAVARYICPLVIETLTGVCREQGTTGAKKAALCVASKFLYAAGVHHLDNDPFPSLKNSFYECLELALLSEDSTLQEISLVQFTFCVNNFSEQQIHHFTEHASKIILHSESASLRLAAVRSLNRCQEVLSSSAQMGVCVKMFLRQLEYGEADVTQQVRDCLPQLHLETSLLGLLVDRLWRIALVEMDHQNDPDHPAHTFACIEKILLNCTAADVDYLIEEWSGLSRPMEALLTSVETSKPDHVANNLEYLCSICQQFSARSANNYLEWVLSVVIGSPINNDESDFYKGTGILTSWNANGTDCTTTNESLMIYPVMGVALSWKDLFQHPIWHKLVAYLVRLYTSTTNDKLSCLIVKCFSSLLNRAPDDVIDLIILEVSKLKKSSSLNYSRQSQMNVWVTKALIMRGYADSPEYLSELERNLQSEEYGHLTAYSYQILLQDFPSFFNHNLGSKIRFLYKQQFFETRIGIMVEQFNCSKDKARDNVLLAIAHLLRHIPQTVIVHHVKTIIPVLLQCLGFDVPSVLSGGIATLVALIRRSPEDFSEHLVSLIAPLLKLSTSADFSVRRESLECLLALCQLPTMQILPYKNQVVSGLKDAIGDRKRIIRNVATTTRSAWDILGTIDDA